MADKDYPMQLDDKYFVAAANDLIKGKQKMTLRESQLLAIAISQVIKEEKDFRTCTTTVPAIAAFMQISEQSLYRDLDKITTDLMSRVVYVYKGYDKRGQKTWSKVHWVERADFSDGKLTLRLSSDLRPYLLGLEEHYSQSRLYVLLGLRSYYATRLYQYLIADYGESNQRKESWSFTIQELRDLFSTGQQYPRAYDLVRKTIKPALKELHQSEHCHIWNYAEHHANTKGKPITHISFCAAFFEKLPYSKADFLQIKMPNEIPFGEEK